MPAKAGSYASDHDRSVAEIKGDGFTTKRSCFEAYDPDLAGIVKMEKELHLTD